MDPTVSELLIDALVLMAVGMTIVYGFLLLLVAMLFGMSRLAHWIAPHELAAGPTGTLRVTDLDGPEGRRVAAIGAAVAQYRRRHPG